MNFAPQEPWPLMNTDEHSAAEPTKRQCSSHNDQVMTNDQIPAGDGALGIGI
jgi:hypothetical protein